MTKLFRFGNVVLRLSVKMCEEFNHDQDTERVSMNGAGVFVEQLSSFLPAFVGRPVARVHGNRNKADPKMKHLFGNA